MPTETKCPKCGSTNVVKDMGGFDCFGCGYKEESDLVKLFDPTKCPRCGSINPSADERGFTCKVCGCDNYPPIIDYIEDMEWSVPFPPPKIRRED
jgi:hypothetical protein